MSSYAKFASFYDALTGNVSYKKRAAYFDKLLRAHNPPGNILLDLACGTGSLSVEFARLGYDVIGVDSSEDMLNEAIEKKYEQGFDIQFLRQSMQDLDMFGTVDCAVCALDSLNHITDPDELQKALSRVSLFLHPQGTFVFDVNTLYKHEQVLRNNTFVYDLEEVYCVWQNQYLGEGLTAITLDFFEPDGKVYLRWGEEFKERAYSQIQMEQMLTRAGLRIEAVYGDDTLEPPGPQTQRLIYVTQKQQNG